MKARVPKCAVTRVMNPVFVPATCRKCKEHQIITVEDGNTIKGDHMVCTAQGRTRSHSLNHWHNMSEGKPCDFNKAGIARVAKAAAAAAKK